MVGTNLGKCEWVWEEKLRWLNPRWPNSRWQNSRWLPSSSWVRMNEFESDWINLSQSFVQNGWIEDGRIQDGRIQDGCHHQVESEWMSEGFFVQMVGTNLGKWEWVWEEKLRWLNRRWPNSRWQNSRWLPSSSWVRMNDFESDWISLSQSGVRVFLSESERRKQGVWIQHGRIQDDCHHQVESEWMSEVFLIQHGRIQDGCHHQVESEWISEVFFVQMVGREVWVKTF